MLLDMEPDLEVVAEAGGVAATVSSLEAQTPDVLILDVHCRAETD